MSSNINKYGILLLCIKLIGFTTGNELDPTIVTLPEGKIQGHILQTANGKSFYAFQEIPYASPPLGKLRFKDPISPESWEDILNTTRNTKICYQQGSLFPTRDVIQTEDCLYLNVYTPVTPGDLSNTSLPVIFWIHGGAFIMGDGTYQTSGPDYFIDNDIIIVSINYRLGPNGFLSTQDDVIPGNNGLKDQTFALQWVNKNIKLFGGDPEKVVIDGGSAGGFSVGLHLLSKKSAGLFRGAILQSGTATVPLSIQPYARYYAFELARALDPTFTSENSTELLEFLQNSSATDINNVNFTILLGMETPPGDYQGFVWSSVLEDENQDGSFVSGYLEENIEEGIINQVPILIGFNSEEELTLLVLNGVAALEEQAKSFDSNLSKVISQRFNMTDEDKYTAGEKLRSIYTDGRFQDDFRSFVSFTSDQTLTTSIIRHADLQSKYTDVFFYQFSYKGLLGGFFVPIDGVDPGGVGHGEELQYLFSNSNNPVTNFPESDILAHQRLIKLWSNFVKYLNPTPEEDSLFENVTWPKVSPNNLVYLNINTTLDIQENPKKYKEWKEVIDTYAQHPFITY